MSKLFHNELNYCIQKADFVITKPLTWMRTFLGLVLVPTMDYLFRSFFPCIPVDSHTCSLCWWNCRLHDSGRAAESDTGWSPPHSLCLCSWLDTHIYNSQLFLPDTCRHWHTGSCYTCPSPHSPVHPEFHGHLWSNP